MGHRVADKSSDIERACVFEDTPGDPGIWVEIRYHKEGPNLSALFVV